MTDRISKDGRRRVTDGKAYELKPADYHGLCFGCAFWSGDCAFRDTGTRLAGCWSDRNWKPADFSTQQKGEHR